MISSNNLMNCFQSTNPILGFDNRMSIQHASVISIFLYMFCPALFSRHILY